MMFHSVVPKYLNYIIHILACSIETSMSHSNSDTFLPTVLEHGKLRRLDFRSAKQTLVLSSSWLSISINFSCQISTETTVNKTYCVLFPCYCKLKIPKVWTFRGQLVAPVRCTISFSHVRSLHGIVAKICLDIYRPLCQIPLYRKMPFDHYSKILVL